MFSRVLCLFSVGILFAQPAADPRAVARKALDLLVAGKYPDLVQMFAPAARAANTEANLAKNSAEMQAWGALQKIGEASEQKTGDLTIVTLPVQFASRNIDFRFGVNAAGLITGMFHSFGAVPWQRPSYSQPNAFREREVTLGEAPFKLPGTLTVPNGSGRFPAVVLVQDIGPQDRDETIGSTKPFKDLAEGLASRGVVVLRYDKRTRLYPATPRLPNYTVQEETVDDAVKATAVLRTQPEVNAARVFLLGHGLGGYLAPRIAEADGKYAGLVLLAANARPLEDLVVDQAAAAGFTEENMKVLRARAARIKTLDAGDVDLPPILNFPISYLLDLKGYDPTGLAKTLGIAMLVLQGERDYQVTMKDFALWKASAQGSKDVSLRSYPALNHLFVAGEGKSTEAEYSKPGHVAVEAVDDIAKWLKR